MTTEEAYNDVLYRLGQLYETREAANIADWIFEDVTGLQRLERRVNKNAELNAGAEIQLAKYVHELLQHKPVQYVLQEAWFYKMKFMVNNHVLIPRPETEELVGWIVNDLRTTRYTRNDLLTILEIGTGSGCIAISLKKELKLASITAIDVSEEALAVARKNAAALQTQIDFRNINFLDESTWNSFDAYDIIVSNPPYIPQIEKEKIAENVRHFEPGIALFVPDNDPFVFYKKIAKFSKLHMQPGGKVFVEIHEDYSSETEHIFAGHNFTTEVKKDMYGKTRMIKATQEKSNILQ